MTDPKDINPPLDIVPRSPNGAGVPNPKTISGTIGGALVVVVISILHRAFHIDLEPEEIGAVTVLVFFLCSYFTPHEGIGTGIGL